MLRKLFFGETNRDHPLMKIQPRRLHAPPPEMRLYGRRHLRNLLLQRGFENIQFNAEDISPRGYNMIIRETKPELDLETRLIMVNVFGNLLQKSKIMKKANASSFQIFWNLKHDTIFIHTKLNLDVHRLYPDPYYTDGSVDFISSIFSSRDITEHLDPELPENLLPETQQILTTIRDWKTQIAQKILATYPETSQDCLQKIVDYVEPHMPLGWQPKGMDTPLAVWNLHQYRLNSLNRGSSVMMNDKDCATESSAYQEIDSGVEDSVHPHGTHLVHDSTHRHGHPEYNHSSLSVQGVGSLLHAQLIAASILRIDWPIPDRRILKEIGQDSSTDQFCQRLQQDCQALVSAVIQDDEMLEFLQQYERIDIHLFCNFLKKHPHLRLGMKRWPGALYSTMIGYLGNLTEQETRARYNCFHTGSWRNHGRWGIEQYSPCGVGYSPKKFLPYKAFSNLVQDPRCTLQDWLNAFYTPEIQEQHSNTKLSALLERYPIFHRTELHKESPNPGIPHEMGKRDGQMRPEQSLLLRFLKPASSLKEHLLHLPVEKMPRTELEWIVAEYLCLGLELPIKPDAKIFSANMLQKEYEIVMMTGLWKHYLASIETAQDEREKTKILDALRRQMEEVHDTMNFMLKMRDQVTNALPSAAERRKFRHANHLFLREFAKSGKKKIEASVTFWGRRADQLLDEHTGPKFLEVSKSGERPLFSWPSLLEKRIHRGQYSVQEISTATDLKLHAAAMSHCVGIYVDKCMAEKNSMHVLEFRKGRLPVATASYRETVSGITQLEFRGRNNCTIYDQTLDILRHDAWNAMNRLYTSENWLKEAQKSRKQQKKLLGGRKHKISKQIMTAIACWNWSVLGQVLPGLPKGPRVDQEIEHNP